MALFRTEYDDLQASVFSGGTTFVVENAAQATSQGVELDGRWLVTEALTLNGSLGYIDFEFDEFSQPGLHDRISFSRARCGVRRGTQCGFQRHHGTVVQQRQLLGRRVNTSPGRTSANTPEFSASLGAQYVQAFDAYELRLGVNANFTDDAYRQEDLDPITLDDATGTSMPTRCSDLPMVTGTWR